MFWFGLGRRPKEDASSEEDESDNHGSATIGEEQEPTVDGENPLVVQLVLIHLADLLAQDTDEGTKLDEVLTRTFEHETTRVMTAREWLQQASSGISNNKESNSPKLAHELPESIRRYIRLSDRYIAWASLLMKRLVFYRAHQTLIPDDHNTESDVHLFPPPDFPIIDLPRTEYKKPFIPRSSTADNTRKGNDRYSDIFNNHHRDIEWFPFSISHQFPWIGVAHVQTPRRPRHDPPFCLGMDIVRMESPNPRLYQSEQEFVDIMGSLTIHERRRLWKLRKTVLLYDFYLVWAMKEAYTKALGVGMGLSFETFGIHLSNMNKDSSIWETLLVSHHDEKRSSSIHDGGFVPGEVTMTREGEIRFLDDRPSERWSFSFVMLTDSKLNTSNSSTLETPECACICWNPTARDTASIQIHELSLDKILPRHSYEED